MSNGFLEYLKAGYPALWVQTHEEDRAIRKLAEEAEGYKIYSWDMVMGLKDHSTGQCTPMQYLKAVQTLGGLSEKSVLLIKDAHKFISGIDMIRTVKNGLIQWKQSHRHLVFISPLMAIPIELEKDVTVFDFPLPGVGDLMRIAKNMINGNKQLKDVEIDESVISAAKGLTTQEAENAMARCLIRHKAFSSDILTAEKLQTIRKSGLMEIWEPVPEDQLGGLNNLKKYIRNRKVGFTNKEFPIPKGIILVGLPGGGKSLSAKVIASILGFPLIRLDLASLKGSLVGQSEQRMKQSLDIIDAIGNSVVWIDEIEKAIGSANASSRTGDPIGSMFGILLTWMQESQVPKYIVATCNDINELLTLSQGALIRRFDDVFFVDLPGEVERSEILEIMNKRYHTQINGEYVSKMTGWTGAEIEKFVKASIYDGEEEALGHVKPIYIQNREVIERGRDWARFNARIANESIETKLEGGERRLDV